MEQGTRDGRTVEAVSATVEATSATIEVASTTVGDAPAIVEEPTDAVTAEP